VQALEDTPAPFELQEGRSQLRAVGLGRIYGKRTSPDKALKWAGPAVLQLRDPGLEHLETDPLLDPLRKQPRFQAIERALKFPP